MDIVFPVVIKRELTNSLDFGRYLTATQTTFLCLSFLVTINFSLETLAWDQAILPPTENRIFHSHSFTALSVLSNPRLIRVLEIVNKPDFLGHQTGTFHWMQYSQ
jgi:hypothetical protein